MYACVCHKVLRVLCELGLKIQTVELELTGRQAEGLSEVSSDQLSVRRGEDLYGAAAPCRQRHWDGQQLLRAVP